MALKKKKKILLLTQQQSRLSDVFGSEIAAIEFVDPNEEATPEEEVISEGDLTTAQVNCLNAAASELV